MDKMSLSDNVLYLIFLESTNKVPVGMKVQFLKPFLLRNEFLNLVFGKILKASDECSFRILDRENL